MLKDAQHMHEQASETQSTLVWRSHLAVVATKTPNKITRTLRTTAMVLVQSALLLVSGFPLLHRVYVYVPPSNWSSGAQLRV